MAGGRVKRAAGEGHSLILMILIMISAPATAQPQESATATISNILAIYTPLVANTISNIRRDRGFLFLSFFSF